MVLDQDNLKPEKDQIEKKDDQLIENSLKITPNVDKLSQKLEQLIKVNIQEPMSMKPIDAILSQ